MSVSTNPEAARGSGERREYPILFSALMVLVLLADRKHVTRRLSKQWLKVKAGDRLWVRETWQMYRNLTVDEQIQQKVTLDRFLNHEIPATQIVSAALSLPTGSGAPGVLYAADFGDWAFDPGSDLKPWRPSIHMPRKYSRILLECEEDARVEWLQDITEEEAEAEGCDADEDGLECVECGWLGFENSKGVQRSGPEEDWHFLCPDCGEILAHWPIDEQARQNFKMLWNTLHTKPGERWEDNPEVVRVGRFHRVEASVQSREKLPSDSHDSGTKGGQ